MNEAEWFRPIDLTDALGFVCEGLSPRRQRLFGCACARTSPAFSDSQSFHAAILLAERIADGEPVPANELCQHPNSPGLGTRFSFKGRWYFGEACGLHEPTVDLNYAIHSILWTTKSRRYCNELTFLQLLREIVGNPFRPVAFDPRWQTSDTVGLAQAIYEDRAFERLPILADALMDAGCEDEQIISHCRGEGPHVRGCWVVDLVLGKE